MSTLDTLPGVTHLRCRAKLDDVVLPELEQGRLKGLAQAGAGGRARALFAGPSGTGKTFAALALANELSAELYKVDLAVFASKYIGETEKNLAAIFDRAAQAGAILMFDEADALFGKRTEVRDAHDRYADSAVAFVAERLAAGKGLTILTTKHEDRIDPAFTRRLDVVVSFPRPDPAGRLLLWRRYLTGEVAADVSIERLAEELDVCGRAIRNAGRRAREIAEDLGRPVSLRDVGEALREVLDQEEEQPVAAAGPLRDLLRGGA